MKAAMTAMESDLKRVWGRKKVEDLSRWKKLTGLGFFGVGFVHDRLFESISMLNIV